MIEPLPCAAHESGERTQELPFPGWQRGVGAARAGHSAVLGRWTLTPRLCRPPRAHRSAAWWTSVCPSPGLRIIQPSLRRVKMRWHAYSTYCIMPGTQVAFTLFTAPATSLLRGVSDKWKGSSFPCLASEHRINFLAPKIGKFLDIQIMIPPTYQVVLWDDGKHLARVALFGLHTRPVR